MSHPEQLGHVVLTRAAHPEFFRGTRVLEVGSRNVNGSVRQFFEDCDYVGLDCTPGDSVDVVCLAHKFKSKKKFDVVISCEAFEHDPHFRKSLANVLRLLRPGGLFVGTWASPRRHEHGTNASNDVDGIFGPDPDYYRGISAAEFLKVAREFLKPVQAREARAKLDVYAVGFRRGRVRP